MPSSRASIVVLVVTVAVGALNVLGVAERAAPMTIRGVVAGAAFVPATNRAPSATSAIYYGGARVCVDTNNNAVCDRGEAAVVTNNTGAFVLTGPRGPLVAEVPAGATSAPGATAGRIVLRASLDQILENVAAGQHTGAFSATVAITPLSTEVVRMMEADGLRYQIAKQMLARRVTVTPAQVLVDPHATADPVAGRAILAEAFVLGRRFALAAKMVDRADVAHAALSANPRATGPILTMKEAQQAAMSLEGIPRYDHIFIIMLENKAASNIRHSPFAPRINAYLDAGNEFTSYYATGSPSEPNRVAVSSGDDFGITDDAGWNCVPEGDEADLPDDPLPAGRMPCTNATNHNLKGRANLFTALTQAGLSWRMYSESMNPGRDWRLDGVADPKLVAVDHVYPATSPVKAIGDPSLRLPFPARLYATKHNGTVAFQDVRRSPEFTTNNRTLGGGQWDDAIKSSPATPKTWSVDEFGTDLRTGDVGALNFLEPDQCDDMHGIAVTGTRPGTTTTATASDCSGDAVVLRGDTYTDALIRRIQASPVWTNPAERVAIVIMFDEASATTGFNSCCGWNPSAGPSVAGESLGVLRKDAGGRVAVDTTIAQYNQGNKGHGVSVFGVLTNQPGAPKGVVDSDAYSHISLVRTLEDMFQLADPGDDWSYMNRSKYTESFIAAHLALLPEYARSADRHFDAVRPMNHAYVIPRGYQQKNGFPAPQVGPDRNQINAWALK